MQPLIVIIYTNYFYVGTCANRYCKNNNPQNVLIKEFFEHNKMVIEYTCIHV